MDFVKHNSIAWDNESKVSNEWTSPVAVDVINKAKRGDWNILLTPTKSVPKEWFGDIKGKDILCLASGGGQQGPILAAAGGRVTVFDNSQEQLKSDELVAKRDELNIKTVQGDMRDLKCFDDETFDIIVHPVSNCFVDNVLKVWSESYRVLKKNGVLLAGVVNPVNYIFDYKKAEEGVFELKNKIPYSDLESFTEEEKQEFINKKEPFEFGHSLEDLIKGQLDAGFIITGFYEDNNGGKQPLDNYIDEYFATCAMKFEIGG